MTGTLSLVSTPIGNLEDITLRAIRTIKEVDIVACEDTRTTGNMLNILGIHAQKLISYHAHSSGDREDYIVSLLLEGQNIALVSDAGTPGQSNRCRNRHYPHSWSISTPRRARMFGTPNSSFYVSGISPRQKMTPNPLAYAA
jgi:hypothetical protein